MSTDTFKSGRLAFHGRWCEIGNWSKSSREIAKLWPRFSATTASAMTSPRVKIVEFSLLIPEEILGRRYGDPL
jgi:hypothetical protein